MTYHDIFFTPEYQDLFKDTAFGGEPCHVEFSGIDYRFYKRPIEGTEFFDIVSPYGYAGPVGNNHFPDYFNFRVRFRRYCLQNNIVSEFARFHPFLENHKHFAPADVYKVGEVVYIDLTKDTNFDKGCKSTIAKALRTAIRTEGTFTPADFQSVYTATMIRREASNDYLFDRTFFEKLVELPGITLGAFMDGKLVSAISVLSQGDYAHYFLSGSTLEQRNTGANNLLISEAIRWAKAHGCKILNLGGTFAGDPGLDSFKKSFSKLTIPFFTYRKIHIPKIYQELSRGIETDYFPAYRGKH